MEEEIDLIELLQLLLKRKWWIISTTIGAMIIGVLITMFMVTPIYESNTTLMVNSSKSSGIGDLASSFDIGSLTLSQKLVVTYSEIVKSRIVLEQVIDRLELDVTYNQLNSSITSKPVGSTEILNISVTDTEPEEAALIANTITDVFIKEVMRILKVNNVEIIDKAISMPNPVNVHVARNGAIAGILGGMFSVFIIFVIKMLDRQMKTAADVEKHLDLPIIGSIIDFNRIKSDQVK
jgi:capsular polysaccharide biosynthesis protein